MKAWGSSKDDLGFQMGRIYDGALLKTLDGIHILTPYNNHEGNLPNIPDQTKETGLRDS